MSATKQQQQSDFYKTLTPYLASAYAEGFGEGEKASADQQRDAWQYLHDTKIGYQLQGWYGRTLVDLLKRKIIKP